MTRHDCRASLQCISPGRNRSPRASYAGATPAEFVDGGRFFGELRKTVKDEFVQLGSRPASERSGRHSFAVEPRESIPRVHVPVRQPERLIWRVGLIQHPAGGDARGKARAGYARHKKNFCMSGLHLEHLSDVRPCAFGGPMCFRRTGARRNPSRRSRCPPRLIARFRVRDRDARHSTGCWARSARHRATACMSIALTNEVAPQPALLQGWSTPVATRFQHHDLYSNPFRSAEPIFYRTVYASGVFITLAVTTVRAAR
jgi:hypothetical protein